MPGASKIPKIEDKFFGYTFGTLKAFIDGFDSGAGLFKIPLWVAGLTITAAYAPYVVSGGLAFGLLCFGKVAYEEYENNKKEHEKIIRKRHLNRLVQNYQEAALEIIQKEKGNSAEIHALILQAYESSKTKVEVDHLVKQEIDRLVRKDYALLLPENRVNKKNNQALLRVVLHDYLNTFGSDPKIYKKRNGQYPGQKKMAQLIQDITGIRRHDPSFHVKVSEFLKDDIALRTQYQNMFPCESNSQPPSFRGNLSKQFATFKAFFKRQKKLRDFVNKAINFTADVASGSGLAASLMRLFGVLIVGAPVAWPLIVIVGLAGLIFGSISLAYSMGRDHTRAANVALLEDEIRHRENRLKLVDRLRKIHKNQEKLKYYHNFGFDSQKDVEVSKNTQSANIKYPLSLYIRVELGILGKIIMGTSNAMMVGLGIAWVATVLFPVIPLVAPTLILGAFLSGPYIYRSLKEEVKSIKDEFDNIREAAEYKQLLQDKFGENNIALNLAKDKRVLLQETIEIYLEFIKALGGEHARDIKGRLPKQEKIMQIIEEVTGNQRPLDQNGKPQRLGNDQFYNQLAQYLGGKDPECKAQGHALAQKLKNLWVLQPNLDAGLTLAPVNADDPAIRKKHRFLKTTTQFLKDHTFSFIAIASTAIMLPLFLAGPHVVIVAPIVGLIIGGFVLSRVANHFATRNNSSLKDEQTKCLIINQKYKIAEKLTHFSGQSNTVQHENQEHARQKLSVGNNHANSTNLKEKEIVRDMVEPASSSSKHREEQKAKPKALGKSISGIWQQDLTRRAEEEDKRLLVPAAVPEVRA